MLFFQPINKSYKGEFIMDKILLNDLLLLDEEEIENTKIKFNIHNGYSDPMDLYLSNPDIINNQWLFWRNNQRYFNVGQIAICLLKLSYDRWLLATIKKVTKELEVYQGVNYEGEEIKKYQKYFGRVIVKHHKNYMTQGRMYDTISDELEVVEILSSVFDGENFPGYDSVNISYSQLKSIIKRGKKDWITALRNQKAVYLITDKYNGSLYVGSATSKNGMLLSRWQSYIQNGHGGNAQLKELATEKGVNYIKENFQYSILENYNSRVDDTEILLRESWWKEVLLSRKFGYNSN